MYGLFSMQNVVRLGNALTIRYGLIFSLDKNNDNYRIFISRKLMPLLGLTFKKYSFCYTGCIEIRYSLESIYIPLSIINIFATVFDFSVYILGVLVIGSLVYLYSSNNDKTQ